MRLTIRERIFGATEDRALTRDNVPSVMLSSPPAGAATPGNAMSISDVYAAVRLLSDACASLPLHTFRLRDNGERERSRGRSDDLLRRPAPAMTTANLIGQLVAHLNLYGNAYLGKYTVDGRIGQLGLLAPDRVTVEIRGGEPVYTLTHTTGAQTKHTTDDIIHFRALGTDGVVGLSPVRQCAVALGLSDSLAEHAANTFANGAVPRGILKLQRFGDQDTAVAELKEAWEGRHKGTDNAGKVAVVSGEVDWTSIEMPPGDVEFLESRKWSTAEVAKCFRVPAHLLGAPTGDSLTYATSESIALDFARYSLAPWLTIIEQRLSADESLFPGNLFCEFSLDGLLRADAATRSEVYAKALDPVTGYMRRDEVRRLENLPPEQTIPEPAVNGAS